MLTECNRDLFGYERVEGRQVVAAFDGGQITSDAGALLLGAANRAIGLVRRLAGCVADGRCQELVEHAVETMLMQRICGIALGYEDLVDHDELRHDPVLATLVGKLVARRADCAPLAGKSTLNRLEHAPASALDRYHKIGHEPRAIEGLFVALSWKLMPSHPSGSCSTSTPPTTLCMASGRLFLPRLLRLPLLSAAVCLLRSPPAGRQAAAFQHRRLGRCPRRGRAHRRPDPRRLA